MMRNIFIKLFLASLFFFPFFAFTSPGYFEPWGKDANIRYGGEREEENKDSSSISLFVAEKVIEFHQKVLSPADGPRSSFRPTSSRYMQLAMRRYGFFKGYIMGCDRLLRENSEKWHYRTKEIDGATYKYDPACIDKYAF